MTNKKELMGVEWYHQQIVDRQNGNGDSRSLDEIFEQSKAMHKEEMINFHIEVMKSGLKEEGERIWEEAYLPKISSIATQKYNETYGGNK
jgi:hypothetical protein